MPGMIDSERERVVRRVSRETGDKLDVLVEELKRWQRLTNLVAPASLDQVWSRHIDDSLQLLDVEPQANRWLDVGSGAGFPGLVAAIAGAQRSGFHVDLVESNARKCEYLRHVARLTGAPATVHQGRFEAVATRFVGKVDVVTARALAPLARLLDWTGDVLSAGAVGLFPKGRESAAELTEAQKCWTFESSALPSRTHPDGRIVRIANFERHATDDNQVR